MNRYTPVIPYLFSMEIIKYLIEEMDLYIIFLICQKYLEQYSHDVFIISLLEFSTKRVTVRVIYAAPAQFTVFIECSELNKSKWKQIVNACSIKLFLPRFQINFISDGKIQTTLSDWLAAPLQYIYETLNYRHANSESFNVTIPKHIQASSNI